MAKPGDERGGESESAKGSRAGKDEALREQLTHNAEAACAERGAHGELLGARGGAGKKKIGEVDARNQEHAADSGPENDKRAAQLSADVVLQRDGDY